MFCSSYNYCNSQLKYIVMEFVLSCGCIFIQSVIAPLKANFSRYLPGVTQRVVRGTALLFHDRGTRRGWVVSSTPRPHFTPGKDPVHILQEAGLAPGPDWTGGKSRPHRDSIQDRPARSQSLYRLSYRAHSFSITDWINMQPYDRTNSITTYFNWLF